MDFKITDLQSYNDMWEQLTTIQRAWDYQSHYMKALPEVAPEEMRQIVQIVDNRITELHGMKNLSAQDIQDLRREAIAMSTVSPDELSNMSKIDVLELERRQISKELGKTFDKCTDVHAVTKNGIRNEVLDGSIFADVDSRMAAYAQAEREMSLASLAKQTDALREEAEYFAKMYSGKATLLDELTMDIKFGDTTSVGGFVDARQSRLILDGEDVGFIQYRPSTVQPDAMEVAELNVTKSGIVNRRFLQEAELLIHDQARKMGKSRVIIQAKPDHTKFYASSGYKELEKRRFSKDLMQPKIHPPQNLDELLGDLENISAIQNAVDERIHDYRRMAELRSQRLTPGKEVDDFHVGSNRLLGEFMNDAREQIDRMVDNLQQFARANQILGPDGQPLPKVSLSDSQLKAVDGLSEVYRLETRNILNTRNRLAEVEAKIPRTPKAKRNARFWRQQRAAKAGIWDEHEVNARRLRNQIG
jgi:hypothetical protein